MKIIDGLSYEQLSASCARRIETEVIENPAAVLALAWGTSTLGVCAELSQEPRRVKFAKSKIFAIDEYLYQDKNGPRFIGQEFLEQNLYRNIDLPPGNRLGPTSVDRLDATLRSLGGIGLGVYGMGENGHVAANEPGTPFESLTHAQLLDPSTVEISARKYGLDPEHLHFAHTMGLATLFSAKKVILLISGSRKFAAALDALYGPVTVDCPASIFQHHPDCTVLSDIRLPRPVAV